MSYSQFFKSAACDCPVRPERTVGRWLSGRADGQKRKSYDFDVKLRGAKWVTTNLKSGEDQGMDDIKVGTGLLGLSARRDLEHQLFGAA